MILRRHDLLSVTPAVWDALLGRQAGLAALPLVADWARQGWPVIVRRPLAGEDADAIPAALPLPPSHGKQRIAFSFLPGDVLRPVPPLLLRDAAVTAPAAWQKLIAEILALADAMQLAPRIFGALLWQHVTGEKYLRAASDLDLLWPVTATTALERLLDGLSRLDAAGPVRLDGEIEFADGSAVNWRELAQSGGNGEVLVKTMQSVSMRPARDFFTPALVP